MDRVEQALIEFRDQMYMKAFKEGYDAAQQAYKRGFNDAMHEIDREQNPCQILEVTIK